MEKILYISPDLIFKVTNKRADPSGNFYDGVVKVGKVKLMVVIQFKCTQAKAGSKLNPVQCQMGIGIMSVVGPPARLSDLSKAINALTVNNAFVAEVCCQAFLNGFLDADF